MTLTDFRDQFDLYYNNIASNQAPGLDDYEKSVFLTDAQEEIVLGLYNGRGPLGDSFEKTEETRRYLSQLIQDASLPPYAPEEGESMPKKLEDNSTFFKLPQNTQEDKYKKVWFIVSEKVEILNGKCANTSTLDVYPARYDDYAKLKKNPFRGANDKRVLRFDFSEDLVELVSNYTIGSYDIRYMRKPKPIILSNLEAGLYIDNENLASDSELPESLHRGILKRAVEIAINNWTRKM